MGSFVTCYLIVWTALALYVARLGANQIKLRTRAWIDCSEQVDRRREAARRRTGGIDAVVQYCRRKLPCLPSCSCSPRVVAAADG